jgi:hypothetical protein
MRVSDIRGLGTKRRHFFRDGNGTATPKTLPTRRNIRTVLAGLVPTIHAAPRVRIFKSNNYFPAWIAGTSPAMTRIRTEDL